MPAFFTPNRHGYNVKFSPHHPNRLAVATSQHYGAEGGGTLFYLELSEDGETIEEFQRLEWNDGLFDLVWSPTNENIVASCSGDGSVQFWKSGCLTPLRVLKEHGKEISSIDWGQTGSCHLLTSSWDGSIKLWDPSSSKSISTHNHHDEMVYSSKLSMHNRDMAISVSRDGNMALWCVRDKGVLLKTKAHHMEEALSCDWHASDANIVCTSGSDGFVKGWDIRNIDHPIFRLRGSKSSVRRASFSPHHGSILATISFDHITRIWDTMDPSRPMESIAHHSEFGYGLDWNRNRRNQLADCAWDSIVRVFTPKSLKMSR